jgi:hypothetical protein
MEISLILKYLTALDPVLDWKMKPNVCILKCQNGHPALTAAGT